MSPDACMAMRTGMGGVEHGLLSPASMKEAVFRCYIWANGTVCARCLGS